MTRRRKPGSAHNGGSHDQAILQIRCDGVCCRSCSRALALLAPAACRAGAQAPSKVTIVVFGFPSLGAFMPPVIKAKKMDEANGLDIEFVERTPDAYTTQFNSGEFKVGGSAARAHGRAWPTRAASR